MAEYIHSAYQSFVDAGVQFLSGTQARLNTLISTGITADSGIKEGAFFLTEDTHRLYVARKTTAGKLIPAPVNEGITTVETQNQLAAAEANVGDFYYVNEGNILCVCISSTLSGGRKWAQLNSNTSVESIEDNITIDGAKKVVSVQTVLTDSTLETISKTLKLEALDNVELSIDNDAKTIKIKAKDTTYTFGGTATDSEVTLTLQGSGTGDAAQQVVLAGDKTIGFSQDDDSKKITISGATVEGLSAYAAAGRNGWDLNVTVTGPNGDDLTPDDALTFDPTLALVKPDGTPEIVHFVNGQAVLNTYNKDAVDTKITQELERVKRTIDSMTYKGTVTQATLPAIIEAHNGDTYKVSAVPSSPWVLDDTVVRVGDLIIANGTEDQTTGLITTGKWEVVPSGDDAVVDGKVLSHGIAVFDDPDGNHILASLNLVEGKNIKLLNTDESTNPDDHERIIQISHELISRVDTINIAKTVIQHSNASNGSDSATTIITFEGDDSTGLTEGEFKAGLTTDNGHVTGVKVKKVEIHDSHANLSATDTKVTVSANVATMLTNIEDTDDTKVSPEFTYSSETLTFSADNHEQKGGLKIELKWGTF